MIRRYRWDGGFTTAELDAQVPAGVTATVSSTNPVFIDIEVLPDPVSADTAQDLDEYLTSEGWVFVAADPTTPLPTSSAQLTFGCEDISATDTVRYLPSGWDDNIATTSPYTVDVTRGGILRNLRVRQNSPAGNGNPVLYTVRINGAPTALVATLSSLDSSGANTADSVVVQAGDSLDIEITKPGGGLSSSPDDVTATLEFASL